jgi:tetratricopeptide (TPR) repeat protein
VGARVAHWILGLAILASTYAFHQKIPFVAPAERDEVFLPKPDLLKLASLGFDAVISDYYWIQALYKVGGSKERPKEYASYVAKIMDVVTTLDPYVGHAYRFAAIWLVDNEESVRKGNDLLRRGIRYHPDDWRNYFYLGFNQFYYLEENEEAAESLEKAVHLEGSPAYLPRLVARLRSEHASLETSAIFMNEMLRSTESDEERAVYRGALDEIEVEEKAKFLDKARESYKKLFGRDIEWVEDLVSGEHPILSQLPRPEPDDLPAARRKGDRWIIDPKTDRITSTYYGRRYKVNIRASAYEWSDRKSEQERGGEEI